MLGKVINIKTESGRQKWTMRGRRREGDRWADREEVEGSY